MATKGFVDYNARRHIQYFASGTMEKGQLVTINVNGYSGIALEHANRYVVNGNPSGRIPIGLVEQKVVDYDLTRQKLNPFDPNEVQTGSKVSIIYDGWMHTNQISGSPTAGASAYAAPSSCVSATQLNAGYALVGKFLTAKDANGYAQVQINL